MTDEQYTCIQDLASSSGLRLVETSTGANGYPSGLGHAIIGFDTFEQLNKFIEQNDASVREDFIQLTPYQFKLRDGWHFYHPEGIACEEFSLTEEYFGCDSRLLSPSDYDDEEQFINEEVKPELDCDIEAFDDMRTIIDRYSAIWDKLEECEENQSVLLYQGDFDRIVDTKCMDFHEDVWEYVIGVKIEVIK